MTEPLAQGSVIGILGGGQLGRMLAIAASRLGFLAHIYDPTPAPPAGHVAQRTLSAPWDDAAALEDFSRDCAVVTYEFENIPLDALEALAAPLRPSLRALQVSQDRLVEKRFLASLGLAVAPHADVTAETLAAALESLGAGILKARRMGYDGKGQTRVAPGDDSRAVFERIGDVPAILEALVPFEREISVILARGADGRCVAFDPGENVHEGGILRTTRVPASIDAACAAEATALAASVAEGLDYVGVLGVELFVTDRGLMVNEIAPRVHNSGHWTQNGCVTDQFEQHIRAIAGWPLGDGRRFADVTMTNLLGAEADDAPRHAADPASALHLYGKSAARPGRKMGHVNRVTGRPG